MSEEPENVQKGLLTPLEFRKAVELKYGRKLSYHILHKGLKRLKVIPLIFGDRQTLIDAKWIDEFAPKEQKPKARRRRKTKIKTEK